MTKTRVGMLCLFAALAVPAGAMAQSSGAGSSDSDAAAFLGTSGDATTTTTTTTTAEGTTTTTEGTAAGSTDPDAAAFLAGQEETQQPVIAAPEEDPELALEEERDEPYFLVGVGAHALFVPDFLINAFGLDMFETVYGWAVGPEFTYRKNGFDIVLSVWWAGYPVDTPSRETGDDASETEIIKSTLGLTWITADFLSGYDFEPWVALIYGGGFGFGITSWGEITRTEAYPEGDGWAPCDGPGSPDTGYCELSGGHYGPVPTRAKGVWPVYPIIRGKIGVRFKPLRNLVITPEFGVGIPELFTLGVRINYMF